MSSFALTQEVARNEILKDPTTMKSLSTYLRCCTTYVAQVITVDSFQSPKELVLCQRQCGFVTKTRCNMNKGPVYFKKSGIAATP